jgi:hypothetical protein
VFHTHFPPARKRIQFVHVDNDANDPLVESDDRVQRKKQKNKARGKASNVHMRVKLLKTQLLQLLPVRFEYVLYLDRFGRSTGRVC